MIESLTQRRRWSKSWAYSALARASRASPACRAPEGEGEGGREGQGEGGAVRRGCETKGGDARLRR